MQLVALSPQTLLHHHFVAVVLTFAASTDCRGFWRSVWLVCHRTLDPTKRLGCGAKGVAEIKEHRWFHAADWESIMQRYVF